MAPRNIGTITKMDPHFVAQRSRFRSPHGAPLELTDNASSAYFRVPGFPRPVDPRETTVDVVTDVGAADTFVVRDDAGGIDYRTFADRVQTYGTEPSEARGFTVSRYCSGLKHACYYLRPRAVVILSFARHGDDRIAKNASVSYLFYKDGRKRPPYLKTKLYDLIDAGRQFVSDVGCVVECARVAGEGEGDGDGDGDESPDVDAPNAGERSLREIVEFERDRLEGMIARTTGGFTAVVYYGLRCPSLRVDPVVRDLVPTIDSAADGLPFVKRFATAMEYVYGDYDPRIVRLARFHSNGRAIARRGLEDVFVRQTIASHATADEAYYIASGVPLTDSPLRAAPYAFGAGKVLVSVNGRLITSIVLPAACARFPRDRAALVSVRRNVDTNTTKDDLHQETRRCIEGILASLFGAAEPPRAPPAPAPAPARRGAKRAAPGPAGRAGEKKTRCVDGNRNFATKGIFDHDSLESPEVAAALRDYAFPVATSRYQEARSNLLARKPPSTRPRASELDPSSKREIRARSVRAFPAMYYSRTPEERARFNRAIAERRMVKIGTYGTLVVDKLTEEEHDAFLRVVMGEHETLALFDAAVGKFADERGIWDKIVAWSNDGGNLRPVAPEGPGAPDE